MAPPRSNQTAEPGAAKRHRSPSDERRQQKRTLERLARDRHETWLTGARRGEAVRVEVASLTEELKDAYKRKRAKR